MAMGLVSGWLMGLVLVLDVEGGGELICREVAVVDDVGIWWRTVHVGAGGVRRVIYVGRLGWCHVVAWLNCFVVGWWPFHVWAGDGVCG